MDWSSMLWSEFETDEVQTGGRNYIQVDMLTNDSLPLLSFAKTTPLPGGVNRQRHALLQIPVQSPAQ